MRVLLDANILISFLLIPHTHSPIYQVVTAGLRGELIILLPGPLLEELAKKAHKKKYLADRITLQELKKLVRLVSDNSETIPVIKEEIPAVTRDPKDDYLLAYALVGGADYLVTGDDDLLVLKQVDKVKIVTPREFVAILRGSA